MINHIDFRRTHDLEELANLLAGIDIASPFTPRELRRLNPFGVELRYDDESIALITRDEADQLTTARSLGRQRSFRSSIRQHEW